MNYWLKRISSIPTKLIFGKSRVILVCGMRRSGNHAFINWLSNALEERSVVYHQDKKFKNLSFSASENITFVNEVNKIRTYKYFRLLLMRWPKIRKSKIIIISLEDINYSEGKGFPFPSPSEKIFIRRDILNLIASRLHNLRKNADKGIGLSRQSVDEKFFNTLKSWESPGDDFLTWHYDQWLVSKSYRMRFLSQMDLKCDIHPTISNEGGGSSFTGTERPPTIQEATSRYKNLTIPMNIRNLLTHCELQPMLSPEELAYLSSNSHLDRDTPAR